MKRGDIWWANLPEPAGRHPVVLISRDRAIQVREAVTVAQVTSTIRNIPVEVKLGAAEGMPRDCVVNCDVLLTIPKPFLTSFATSLSDEKIAALDRALRFALALQE